MDTIFMNSKNSYTCDPHILLRNLADKTNLKKSHENVSISSSIYYASKNTKTS